MVVGAGTLPETIMEVEYSLFTQEFRLPFGAMFHFHVCWTGGYSLEKGLYQVLVAILSLWA